MSRGPPTPTSPGRPLKILFDRSGDVPTWRTGKVPIWVRRDILKWRSGDVLIWLSRDVSGNLIRTYLGRSRDVPWRTFRVLILGCSKKIFYFFFRTYWIKLYKSISTLKVYWEPSETSKTEHFLWNLLLTSYLLTIFVKELHLRSSTGFLIRLWYCLVMLFGILIGW